MIDPVLGGSAAEGVTTGVAASAAAGGLPGSAVSGSAVSGSALAGSALSGSAVIVGVVVVCGFAVGGAVAGWAVCLALARARRPAVVPCGVCAAVTGAVWAWLAWRAASDALPWWWLPVPLVVTAVATPLAAADLRYRRLPDVVTLPAVPVVLVAVAVAAVTGPGPGVDTGLLVGAVLGVVGFSGAHLLVRVVLPGSLGAGDVKLAAALGGALGAVGWPALVVAACLASVVTLALAAASFVVRAARGVRGAGSRFSLVDARGTGVVPHGPGMLLGACLVAAFPGAGMGAAMGLATGVEMGVVTAGTG